MLFILIPLSLIIVSLIMVGTIIYRRMPQDLAEWNSALEGQDFGPTFYEKALTVASGKTKQIFLNLSTKLIYRLKIASLKTDNFSGKLLREIRTRKQDIAAASQNQSLVAEDENKSLPAEPNIELDSKSLAVLASEEFQASSVPAIASEEIDKKGFSSSFLIQEQQLINRLTYNPNDVSVYKRLGWLYLENDKPLQARQSFKMSVKLGSKDKHVIAKLLEMGGVVHKEGPPADIELLTQNLDNKSGSAEQARLSVKKQAKVRTKRLKITKV